MVDDVLFLGSLVVSTCSLGRGRDTQGGIPITGVSMLLGTAGDLLLMENSFCLGMLAA